MIAALQRAAADNMLTREAYQEWASRNQAPSSQTMTRKFGSWNGALRAAKVDISRKTPKP